MTNIFDEYGHKMTIATKFGHRAEKMERLALDFSVAVIPILGRMLEVASDDEIDGLEIVTPFCRVILGTKD